MPHVLILGYGEIGKSLFRLYENNKDHTVYVKDVGPYDKTPERVDVLHVCISFSNHFVRDVVGVAKKWNPSIVIIHSTVVPFTTDKIAAELKNCHVVHSYVTGKHPNLTQSLLTFVKAVGGNKEACFAASQHLNSVGITTGVFENSVTSEIAKLSDTTNYFANILHMKAVFLLCKKYGANFGQAYVIATDNYNAGYEQLGLPQFKRQRLTYTSGVIGGHCVVPNAKILSKQCGDVWSHCLLQAYKELLELEGVDDNL